MLFNASIYSNPMSLDARTQKPEIIGKFFRNLLEIKTDKFRNRFQIVPHILSFRRSLCFNLRSIAVLKILIEGYRAEMPSLPAKPLPQHRWFLFRSCTAQCRTKWNMLCPVSSYPYDNVLNHQHKSHFAVSCEDNENIANLCCIIQQNKIRCNSGCGVYS